MYTPASERKEIILKFFGILMDNHSKCRDALITQKAILDNAIKLTNYLEEQDVVP